MRRSIVLALLVKEAQRHVANRGGIALCLLLVVAALLLSVFNPGVGAGGTGGGSLVDGVHRCLVQYPEETPFVASLRASLPPGLQAHVVFEQRRGNAVTGLATYPPGTGAIQLRQHVEGGRAVVKVAVWHPPGNAAAMAPYEAWFWRAARDALAEQGELQLKAAGVNGGLPARDPGADDLWAVRDAYRQLHADYDRKLAEAKPGTGAPRTPLPEIAIDRHGIGAKELDLRSAVATGMVVFALYFFCVYLLPTITCEERERGVLLAQALSPASPAEIVAAKFLFYPTLGMALAAVLAGIYQPAILSTLFFWLAILAMGGGFLGVGMTVATLAKTQRAAFMGSMCYLMSVALLLFICTQNGLQLVPNLAIEYHGPKVIHAAITREVYWVHWMHLAGLGTLALLWMGVAARLFRKRGWQ